MVLPRTGYRRELIVFDGKSLCYLRRGLPVGLSVIHPRDPIFPLILPLLAAARSRITMRDASRRAQSGITSTNGPPLGFLYQPAWDTIRESDRHGSRRFCVLLKSQFYFGGCRNSVLSHAFSGVPFRLLSRTDASTCNRLFRELSCVRIDQFALFRAAC